MQQEQYGISEFHNQEEPMATTKKTAASSAKNPSSKPALQTGKVSAAKVKTVAPTKKAAVKKPAVAKTAPKVAEKAADAKPVRSRAKKPTVVPADQRGHYVEMAAYYIAERRGFSQGNPFDDWVQAEAEIDRLLAQGLLGGESKP
jgi:hypothetical protein